jgi:hypothetical protein
MKRKKWQAILFCTVGLFAVVATAANTVHASDSGESTQEEPNSAAQPVDVAVASYALEYSVSQTEASRRLERIGAIQETLASIRGLEAARTAGWGIDHRGGFTGWVLLTGDDPAGAESAAVADTHSDVEIRTGAQHSYTELQAAQRNLSAQLFAAQSTGSGALGNTGEEGQAAPGAPGDLDGAGIGAGVAEVVTFLETDMAGNAVRVGIDLGLASEIGPLGSVSELSFDQGAAVVAEMLQGHIEVAFTVADGRGITPAASFQAGEEITGCTSGFTARKNRPRGFDYGIVTAGHCGDNGPTDTSAVTMNGVSLPFVYGWLSPTADAQFHRIPAPDSGSHHVADDYICRDPASYPNHSCDVTGTIARAKMQGSYVCHTGKNSGISCGTVVNTDHMLDWSDDPCLDSSGEEAVCNSVFVKVEGQWLKGCKGDSGGPFYRGGTAYGIMAGTTDRDDCTSEGKTVTFSAIKEVEAFLRMQVLTEPVTLAAS